MTNPGKGEPDGQSSEASKVFFSSKIIIIQKRKKGEKKGE